MSITAISVGLFLASTLLVVHFTSTRHNPLKTYRPLDDDDVPFPAAGQASTVFSLSVLFGCYAGIFLLVGAAAIVGVTAGTATALFLIYLTRGNHREGYESFLEERQRTLGDAGMLAYFVQLTQVGLAVSELVFLRVLLITAFDIAPGMATMITLGVAFIGYCYCLIGGYNAVFRTDILQLIMIGIMCGVLIYGLLLQTTLHDFLHTAAMHIRHKRQYWSAGVTRPGAIEAVLDFATGFAAGCTFLLASPDTWKRVYIVSRPRRGRRRSMILLAAAAALPFLAVTPLILSLPPLPFGPINPQVFVSRLARTPLLLDAALLGVIASFLSAFDSALISAMHLNLLSRRSADPIFEEASRFRNLGGLQFLFIAVLFLVAIGFGNPALMATILMGTYAIAGGLILGTRGGTRSLPYGAVPSIIIVAFTAWFALILPDRAHFDVARSSDINFVPASATEFLATTAVALLLARSTRPEAA